MQSARGRRKSADSGAVSWGESISKFDKLEAAASATPAAQPPPVSASLFTEAKVTHTPRGHVLLLGAVPAAVSGAPNLPPGVRARPRGLGVSR